MFTPLKMQNAEMFIDLHGCTVQQAKQLLSEKFAEAKEKKIIKFRIVTGRGKHANPNGQRAVLKNALPKLLKPYCDEIQEVDKELGAYTIRLKKNVSVSESLLQDFLLLLENDEEQLISALKLFEATIGQKNAAAMTFMAIVYLSGEYEEFNDKEKALTLLNEAKEKGDLDAYAMLGELYLEGVHVKKNYKLAVKYLEYGDNKNHDLSIHLLAKCYMFGYGVTQNDSTANELLEKAAKLGNAEAQFNLGYTYYTGEGVEKADIKLAVKWLSLAAFRVDFHPSACSYLARCYGTGDGVKRNDATALSLYEQAAQYDDMYALYQAGRYYFTGRGEVKPDLAKAFNYYMRGAELGDSDCRVEVGHMYLNGVGVEKNSKEGAKWIQQAAAQKNLHAYCTLARLYREGIEVTPDAQKADQLLQEALQKGLARAQYEQGLNFLKQQRYEEGLALLEKAAAQNYLEAIKFMGNLKNTAQQTLFFKPQISSEILKKYELPNTSQNSLEKGLRNAANNNFVDDLKIFIELVENLDACDDKKFKRTALHWAVINNHQESINLLLEAGASFSVADASGKTALEYANKETLKLLTLLSTKPQEAQRVSF